MTRTEAALQKLSTRISSGITDINQLFPGIAAVNFTTEGTGAAVSLRIVKREGIPVTLVPEGSADSSVVSVKGVSELDYYSLRFTDLAHKLDITTNQVTALVSLLRVKNSEDYAKEFFHIWCYSPKALERMREAVKEKPITEWWAEYRAASKSQRRSPSKG